MGDKGNATPSWSGYNHQGKVGIFLALNELMTLIKNNKDYKDYKLEFENGTEDIDIKCSESVISRHQVKAYTKEYFPKKYEMVRKIKQDNSSVGFRTEGTTDKNRYLHVTSEVKGWYLDEENFKKEFPKADYVNNESKVQLYTYPDNKMYCSLTKGNDSPSIDFFCETCIKEIMILSNNPLKDDDIHIEEILFEIKDLISNRVSEAHKAKNGAYPKITFEEIYNKIESTDKRESQSIHKTKNLLEIYWNNKFYEEENNVELDLGLFNDILNLPNEKFKQFIIDLNPHESIEEIDKINGFEGLVEKTAFKEIFCEFYKMINQEKFKLEDIKYTSTKHIYRLSLINNKANKKGEISQIVKAIRNNRQWLNTSFEVDYLVNGRINSHFFGEEEADEYKNSKYTSTPSKIDDIFSSSLEFIDIDKAVEKLEGERYE